MCHNSQYALQTSPKQEPEPPGEEPIAFISPPSARFSGPAQGDEIGIGDDAHDQEDQRRECACEPDLIDRERAVALSISVRPTPAPPRASAARRKATKLA